MLSETRVPHGAGSAHDGGGAGLAVGGIIGGRHHAAHAHDVERRPQTLPHPGHAPHHRESGLADRRTAHAGAVAPGPWKRLVALRVHKTAGNRVDRAQRLHRAMRGGAPHHLLDLLLPRQVRELDHERGVADLVLHGVADAPHKCRIVAQQAVMPLVRAAGIHLDDLGTGFLDQTRGGDAVGDVFLIAHAGHARALETADEQLPRPRMGDGGGHVRLPDVGVLRGHAERIGDGDAGRVGAVVRIGKHALVFLDALGVDGCAARVHRQHIREPVARPRTRAHGFVDGDVEAHAERRIGEMRVEQRTGRDAEGQVQGLAEERFGPRGRPVRSASRHLGLRGAGFQGFGEGAERPLRIVVFVAQIHVVKRCCRCCALGHAIASARMPLLAAPPLV